MLNVSAAGGAIPGIKPEAIPPPSELVSMALDFDSPLLPFTAQSKPQEVNACLEALEQLGYAWPMEEEVASLCGILNGDPVQRRFSPTWALPLSSLHPKNALFRFPGRTAKICSLPSHTCTAVKPFPPTSNVF